MSRAWLSGIALATVLVAGCGDGVVPAVPADAVPRSVAPATLHRLTVKQYQQTVRSLFGDSITVPTDLEADTPLHGYSNVGASELTVSPHAAEQYENAAYALARQVWDDPVRRTALLGEGCTPATLDDPCVRTFLKRFGLRAWRRPLTTLEIDDFLSLAKELVKTLGGVPQALEYTVAAMLQSPHFLFRVEVGEHDPAHPGERIYTSFEMASRLSYLLHNTMPDDELLAAAARGELTTTEGLSAQTLRLLANPAARTTLLGFFGEYFNLGRLDNVTRDKTLFPLFTPALVAAMREEIIRNVDDVVFGRSADYRELLSGTSTFLNADLATLYGVPAPPMGWARTELPPSSGRGGLLGTAGILTLNANATLTSPTHRGKFVRSYLLCQDIPPPPAGAVTSLDPPSGTMPTTLRQRLSAHRENPACRGCHAMMDPIGFGLERFDAIGAWRELDNGLPIDASANLDGRDFEGPRELGAALADHPGLAVCVARQLYRHATGHVEERGEETGIGQLGEGFAAAEFRFSNLLLKLVLSDGFRRASVEAETNPQEGG